jgi:hypothetical protein
MSTILLGSGNRSILHHWEGLAEPAPYVPGFTVALAAVSVSKITDVNSSLCECSWLGVFFG